MGQRIVDSKLQSMVCNGLPIGYDGHNLLFTYDVAMTILSGHTDCHSIPTVFCRETIKKGLVDDISEDNRVSESG